MSQAVTTQNNTSSLTGLLLPLSDRTLLVPNVALAELIPYRAPQAASGLPEWLLGQVAWRDLRLPLLSFEAAAGGEAKVGSGARVAVLNALGGRPHVKFIALVLQGIPRSLRVEEDLRRADAPLSALELDAVQLGTEVAKVPDLVALEQLLADAGLI
ncbi:chemotaxis protein CheW [Metapseudomonas resinovorans]|uniref:Putative chemosensory signal transduction system protein ChpC n=1 Tax=Metapseudomonas resinovorans NBRC 106553 TaxID=1245471 RepID=S6AQI9_METRE|nr:chemotaxis protein CheW [Pseudomonas resinovorans]BAN46081.1 putative chemosensory signal transduction system protein ChpC [Pseudomonas resinovorans NBRC 106553]